MAKKKTEKKSVKKTTAIKDAAKNLTEQASPRSKVFFIIAALAFAVVIIYSISTLIYRNGKTKTGRPYGRPKKERPANWEKIYGLWKEKKIKTSEARILLGGMGKNLFYRFVHEMNE